MTLSYTLLSTWAICPHQAARRYIIKDIPYEGTPAMAEGKEIRASLAKYIEGGPPPDKYADLAAPLVGKCQARAQACHRGQPVKARQLVRQRGVVARRD
jgi:hypothetical protein